MTREIHVAGPKDGSDMLGPDEVLCGTKLPICDAVVIFHPRAMRLSGGGFVCPDCGASSRPAVSSGA